MEAAAKTTLEQKVTATAVAKQREIYAQEKATASAAAVTAAENPLELDEKAYTAAVADQTEKTTAETDLSTANDAKEVIYEANATQLRTEAARDSCTTLEAAKPEAEQDPAACRTEKEAAWRDTKAWA